MSYKMPDPAVIAEVAFEATRVWYAANGDTSKSTWAEAPKWMKLSTIAGVRYHITHPKAPAAGAIHEEWVRQQVINGWSFGPVEDAERKQHPHMVPFEYLPDEVQATGRLFRAIVHALVDDAL